MQNLERDSSKEQDFKYTEAILLKNSNKNRNQKPLPRKNLCKFFSLALLSIVYVADTSRVILPQLDGDSDYINFCYIDVSRH